MPQSLKALSSEFLAQRTALIAYLRGLVHDHNLAEDLFQEVYLRLAEAVERGTEIEDVARWCRGVARNLALRYWREERTGKVIVDSDLVTLVDQAFDENDRRVAEWGRRREALRHCSERLSGFAQHVIRLKYVEGCTVKAMAEILQRSSGAILVALHRARRALLKCVEQGASSA